MVIEMPLRQRNINVAAFADRLAVVQRLKHSKQTRMLLQKARNGIKHPGATMPAQLCPFALRLARGCYGGFHIGLRALGHIGQHVASGRVAGFKGRANGGELPVDEVTKAVTHIDQPRKRLGSPFWGGAIIHAFKNVANGHARAPASTSSWQIQLIPRYPIA